MGLFYKIFSYYRLYKNFHTMIEDLSECISAKTKVILLQKKIKSYEKELNLTYDSIGRWKKTRKYLNDELNKLYCEVYMLNIDINIFYDSFKIDFFSIIDI